MGFSLAQLGKTLSRQAAYDFATFYERRESDRWALADICGVLSVHQGELVRLADELENNFGIRITATSLGNYARVAKSFEDKHRLPYKWSNYLEWSKHSDPIKAMELALDNGYSPTQMSRLRRHGDPEYKKESRDECDSCGKKFSSIYHVCPSCLKINQDVICTVDPDKTMAENIGIKRGEKFKVEIDYGPPLKGRDE